MDVFFYSVIIVGFVLFIKVLIIVCVYMCRARKLRRRQLAEREAAQNASGRDASLYPTSPYNQQSPFVNFEETPQPVITVAPGETPQTLQPEMLPPPYSLAVSGQYKPPAYDDIYKDSPGGASSEGLGAIDAGQECTAPVHSLQNVGLAGQVGRVAASDVEPTRNGADNAGLAEESSTDEDDAEEAQMEDRGTEEAQVASAETVGVPGGQQGNYNADGHATVTPGGGIAIV